MLTNREIRALPMPRITHETKMLALQNADHNVFVVTSGKIKSNIVINVFSKNEDGRSMTPVYIIYEPIKLPTDT